MVVLPWLESAGVLTAMDEIFLRLKALADRQIVADAADYLNCKSFDTIGVDTDGRAFDFLRELPFDLHNCLLIGVTVAILRHVAGFSTKIASVDGRTSTQWCRSGTSCSFQPRVLVTWTAPTADSA
jgi:hypothetical protein